MTNQKTVNWSVAGGIALVAALLFGWLVWACASTVIQAASALKEAAGKPHAVDVNFKYPVTPAPGGDDGDVQLGHGGPLEMIPYPSAIGSASSPSTMSTTTFDGASTTVLNVGGLPNMAFNVGYTPKAYGSRLLIQIERAFDVTCSNFYQWDTLTIGSDAVLVNTQGTSSALGVPFVINNEGTYASGTRRTASWDMSLAATCARISMRESVTGTPATPGTANLEAYFTSN